MEFWSSCKKLQVNKSFIPSEDECQKEAVSLPTSALQPHWESNGLVQSLLEPSAKELIGEWSVQSRPVLLMSRVIGLCQHSHSAVKDEFLDALAVFSLTQWPPTHRSAHTTPSVTPVLLLEHVS